jgi:hypothetical protein
LSAAFLSSSASATATAAAAMTIADLVAQHTL